MIAGGRNPTKTNEVLRSAFFYSAFVADDVEQLQPMKEKRESCSLCILQSEIKATKLSLMRQSSMHDSDLGSSRVFVPPSQVPDNTNQKVLAVGGLFDPRSNDYNENCEVFDLLLDTWSRSAKIKVERLSPFVIPVGIEKALIIGGSNHFQRSFEALLIK